MKKLFFVVLMALLCTTLFAERYSLIGLDGSFQVMNGSITISDQETDFKTYSPAIGFSMFYYTDESNWGMKLASNLFFPTNGDITIEGQKYSFSDDDFDGIIGTESLFAAIYLLKKTESFMLPLSLGIHYTLYTFNLDNLISYGSFNLGIGTSLTAINYFSENFYFLTDLQISCDFYQYNWYSLPGGINDDNSGGVTQFVFTPKIGAGFRIKHKPR